MKKSSPRKKKGRARHYVYIVRCAGGELYTGYTVNPKRRLTQHNEGKGAKFTRSRLPVALVHVEEFGSKSKALRREFSIKRLSRQEKLRLIAVP